MTKRSSLSSDLSALWIYSSAAVQGQWPWGMPYHCRDICTWCCGHQASSIREKQPFVSFQLSNLERMPAALFWLSILTNKLRLLPREAHSPGKFILTKNVRLKGERQPKSLLKDVSTAHGHHFWQNPKATASASICSVSSSPKVIYSSWVSGLLHLYKVQKSQWIQISVNLAFKYYSSTYNSNGN